MVLEEFVTREQAVGILTAYLKSPAGTKPNFEITLVAEIDDLCDPSPELNVEATPALSDVSNPS